MGAPYSPTMTREELKKVLASKPNKLAKEAIEAVRGGEPLETLKKIVEEGAADRHYFRDPLHPRSKYRVEHVLDSCFGSSFGVVSEKTSTGSSCTVKGEFALGHIPATGGKAEHFAYLLDKGFPPGSNGYRGELFQAILKSCFYREPGERAAAIELSKILTAKGKVDIQKFAENSYEWTGSRDKLQTVLQLGAKPTPAMLDCALRYCACAANPGDPESGRADVLRDLLDAGATPSKPLGSLGSSKDQISFLKKAGLSERICGSTNPLPMPTRTGTGRPLSQPTELAR